MLPNERHSFDACDSYCHGVVFQRHQQNSSHDRVKMLEFGGRRFLCAWLDLGDCYCADLNELLLKHAFLLHHLDHCLSRDQLRNVRQHRRSENPHCFNHGPHFHAN